MGWAGRRLLGLSLPLLLIASCTSRHPDARALNPQQSLHSMRLSDDFHVELFASEPEVVDPVEMVFDENGKVYVAEMIDYPEDPPPGKPARSRIRLLEDTNGDGKIDRSTIFADQVLQVSGIFPWRGGLIVTSAPDILYFKDTNGDGKADVRRVLYTGFPKVNPEGRITNLRLGIDNWIYAANSGAAGRITSPEHPELPAVSVRGADFRFRPDGGPAEAASGPTQFGMTFDDWGNRFLTQNTTHIRHAVLPMQYLVRAPLLPVPAVAQDISDHGRPSARMFPLTRPQAWRRQRTSLRQKRYDENGLNRKEEVGGWFTAASGGTMYNGDVFPKEYWGNVFTGDVSGNLVHRDILTRDGATFSAHRAQDNIEFLASTDVWFRPCNFANAPDGNLYMLDIYREYIETPESIPEEIKKNMDFWSGADKGRIYRIAPNQPLRKSDLKVNLGAATGAELVKQLENPNGWNRDTAHRLLLERQDRAAIPLLQDLAQRSEFPQARLHALWLLEAMSALDPPIVLRALRDPHVGVRANAVRLSEPFLAKSQPVAKAVLAMKNDRDASVQFQATLTLGGMQDPRALQALADIAGQRAGEHWFRLAILSSVHDTAYPFFHLLVYRNGFRANPAFFSELCSLIGARHDPAEVARFLRIAQFFVATQPAETAAALFGLAKGLKLSGAGNLNVPGAEAVLMRFLSHPSEQVQSAAWETARYLELRSLIQKASQDALNPFLPPARRVNAIRALRSGRFPLVLPVLRQILTSRAPPEIEMAAVDSLSAFDDPAAAPELLRNWKAYGPETRKRVIAALLHHRDRVHVLLKALQDHRIETSAVELPVRSRLMQDPDVSIATQARNLFQDQTTDRAKVVKAYSDVLKMSGNVNRGKTVFDENCARCHMPRRQGGRVGPDLSGINNKTREELLTSILNPSYAIEPRFLDYIVNTRDGRIYDGVIASETPGAITLRGGSEEGDEVVLRKNIAEIRVSGVSLMPEGLEQGMSKQDLADVIAYLRGGL